MDGKKKEWVPGPEAQDPAEGMNIKDELVSSAGENEENPAEGGGGTKRDIDVK